LAVTLFVLGCGQGAGSPRSADSTAAATPASRTAVFISHVEPKTLSQHRAMVATGISGGDSIRVFNASLFIDDHQGEARPYLAESQPQLNSDNWRVFPDGRMETTYHLRPGLVWHDGMPLTPQDFILSWRMEKDPAYGVSELMPMKVMDEVTALDDRTLRIRWSQPFPRANGLSGRDLAPLPRHILEAPFEQERSDVFVSLPYWTREHVGLGAYRMDRWEPGAFLEGSAFEGHAFGRPKIDRIKIIFMGDPNTAVANLLAGEAQMAWDFTLAFEQGILLKRQWQAGNAGRVIFSPERSRYVAVQFNPQYTDPREILDVRVRRALAHAVDKQALIEGLMSGEGQAADTMVAPTVSYFGEVEKVITRYPHDPQRAARLLTEAGMTRGADGWFVRSNGERFSPELRGTVSGQEEQEVAIVSDNWRRAGVDVRVRLTTEVENQNREFRSGFPAFLGRGTELEEESNLGKLYGPQASSPANRYAGNNRGGWLSREFDSYYDVLLTALDHQERNRAIVQAMKLVSEELPQIMLYYNYVVQAHVGKLQGPAATAPGGERTWNIHEWTID